MTLIDGPARGEHVGARVVAGSATLLGANFAARVVGLLNIAVLARLLAPEDYGLIAMAMVVFEFGKTATELQVGNALIRLPALEDSHYRTSFTLSLMRGAALALLVFASAEPVAVFFETPTLAPVLRWLALAALLDGMASPRFIDYARRVDFRYEALLEILSRLITLTVAIAYALYSANYWAIVFGIIASTTISMAMTHVLAPWRPALGLAHWRMVLSFGGWLTIASIVGFANAKLSNVLIGKMLGATTLGVYAIGDQLATIATNQLAAPFVKAIYAGLSQIGEDETRLEQAYVKAQSSVLAVVLPTGVGVALVAREAILVTAGAKWLGAVIVIQMMAPIIAVSMITAGVHALAMVRGATKSLLACNAANLAFRLPVLYAGLIVDGLTGLLFARLITGVFMIATHLYLVVRLIGRGFFAPFIAGWRSFAATAAMAVAVLALDASMATVGNGFAENAAALTTKAAIGAAVYVGAHMALWIAAGRPAGFETTALEAAGRALGAARRAAAARGWT